MIFWVQICLSALSLVCESIKTTDAPPPSHLQLLLDFVGVNGNTPSPGFRDPALTALKKVEFVGLKFLVILFRVAVSIIKRF